MKIKPILFSTPMVQAILEDEKTQTRRIIKPQPDDDGLAKFSPDQKWYDSSMRNYEPKAHVGDILWVRETLHFYAQSSLPNLLKS